MLANACNPSTLEAEAGGPRILEQPGLHSKILSQTNTAQHKEKKGIALRKIIGQKGNGLHGSDNENPTESYTYQIPSVCPFKLGFVLSNGCITDIIVRGLGGGR
jgi:hypothetical protein